MSRDFIGSIQGRSFRQSPNRDRITRGTTALTQYFFEAGVRAGDSPIASGADALFPFPAYGTGAGIFQQLTAGTMPFDTLTEQLATPFVIGDIFKITMLVEGVMGLYDPAEEPEIELVTWTPTGQPPRNTSVIKRPARAGLSLNGFIFKPLTDALASVPRIGGFMTSSYTSGSLALLNYQSGGGGISYWKKQVVVYARSTVNRPAGYSDGGGARAQVNVSDVAWEPGFVEDDFVLVATAVALRNQESINHVSTLVAGINVLHTPITVPATPPVGASSTMFLGKIIGWEKTTETDLPDTVYADA